MSPPLLSVEEGVRNYLGFPDCSADSPAVASLGNKNNLNLKATELRLGLPGSQSPERGPELCLMKSGMLDEKPLFPLHPSKDGICSSMPRNVVSGNKRGFCDTMEGGLSQSAGINAMLSTRPSGAQAGIKKDASTIAPQERPQLNLNDASNISSSQPAAKAQVVGWPPVRSFRTKTLATTSKSNDEVDGKPGPGPLFVKVSMDGAPFLRKVDLRTYSTYGELSAALEKMFRGFTIGQYGSHSTAGRDVLSESKLKDLLHGSEYVLTYEDKDGDWMLVGDVPWEFFIDTCKKLKIMKGSDAIGLAPRVMEKSKNKN